MKTAKKLLALLLALAMVLCFTACGKNGSKGGKINGTWVTEIDATAFMASQLSAMGIEEDKVPDLILSFQIEFDGKNEYTFSVEENATEKAYNKFLEKFEDLLVDFLYDQGEDAGYSKSEYSALFEEQYELSIEEYVTEYVKDSMSFDSFKDSFEEETGYYKVKGDKIYVAEDEDELDDSEAYVEFELDGKKLSFKDYEDNAFELDDLDELGVELPLVFNKK